MGKTFNTGRLGNGLFVDANGNVGIGTSIPSELLHLYKSSTVYQIIQTVSGGAGTVYRRSNSTTPDWTIGHGAASANENFEVYTAGTGAFTWTMNGSERVRITSAGKVGIGQTSPSYILDVSTSNSNSVFAATTTFTHTGGYLDHSAFLAPNMTGGALSVSFGKSASNYNTGKFVFNYAGNNSTSNSIGLGFYNADNLLVVKGDGRIGLSVTPSGWGGVGSAIQFPVYGSISTGDDGWRAFTTIGFNMYNSTGWTPKYIISNSYATAYRQRDGAHEFFTAGNGTADATISFTQAVTFLANGNVGIGLTSPGHKLEIWNTTHNVFRVVNTGSANGNSPTAQFLNSYGNHSWGITAEFRVGASGGEDRPSILFSNGFDNNTWACGFGYADSSYFRINKDQGPYSGSWGVTLFSLDRSGNYSFAGSNVSDRRNKKDITYITESQIDNILKLKPATFVKKSPGKDEYSEHTHTGFIAQDILEDNIPNLVHGSEEKGYGLDYDGILALAVKAIQELKAEIEILKNK